MVFAEDDVHDLSCDLLHNIVVTTNEIREAKFLPTKGGSHISWSFLPWGACSTRLVAWFEPAVRSAHQTPGSSLTHAPFALSSLFFNASKIFLFAASAEKKFDFFQILDHALSFFLPRIHHLLGLLLAGSHSRRQA